MVLGEVVMVGGVRIRRKQMNVLNETSNLTAKRDRAILYIRSHLSF